MADRLSQQSEQIVVALTNFAKWVGCLPGSRYAIVPIILVVLAGSFFRGLRQIPTADVQL